MVDSLNIFRKVFPKRSSYKQEDLVRGILFTDYKAHNAEEDVKSLASLVSKVVTEHGDKHVQENSFPATAAYFNLLSSKACAKNMPGLSRLVAFGIMKTATAENIAGSGLNVLLKKIYERSGENGLRSTFTVTNGEGQPRVTNAKRTLEDVVPKLAKYFEKESVIETLKFVHIVH